MTTNAPESREARHQKTTVDIAICSDKHQFVGMLAVMCSVIRNTEHPDAIFFHLLTAPGESSEIIASIERSFASSSFRYEVREFHPDSPSLDRYYCAGGNESHHNIPYRATRMNCSRFYLANLFPDLGKIIYLDPDIIVKGDVTELFREANLEEHDVALVPRESWGGQPIVKDSPDLAGIDFDCPGFNAGVFVADLGRWREKDIVSRFEFWMDRWAKAKEERSETLFYFGSQFVMLAVFHKKFQALSPQWNFVGLGHMKDLLEADLEEAKILHWTGSKKPWKPDGMHKKYWTTI